MDSNIHKDKVLIVEDDESMRDMLELILREEYEVITARSVTTYNTSGNLEQITGPMGQLAYYTYDTQGISRRQLSPCTLFCLIISH